MDKLELKDIAPYLPHKPIVIVNDTERNLTAVSIDSEFVFVTQWKGSRERQMIKIESIKPILRPMTDLNKLITHKGNDIVPIVELVKMLYGEIDNYEILSDWKINVYDDEDDDFYSLSIFAIFEENPELFFRYSREIVLTDNRVDLDIRRPQALLNKLYELQFDVNDLIGRGLAINLNEVDNGK
ncbi:TPA: hypothetical protein ACG0AP_003568 [Elizabethkingia anophelis]